MLKLKDNAIKTMANALAKISDKKEPKNIPAAEMPEAIRLNQKLREAFSLLGVPKNIPSEQSNNASPVQAKLIKPSLPPSAKKNITNSVPAKNNPFETEVLDSIKKQLEIDKKKAAEEAEAQKKREQEQRAIEEKIQQEKLRAQKEIDEKKAREEAEAQKKREQEQRAIEEKIQQEKQLEIDKKKAREEKRRRLALLEAERENKMRQDLERQKQEAIKNTEASRKRNLDLRDKPGETDKDKELPAALQNLISKSRAKRESFEKQLAAIPVLKAPLEQKRLVMESKVAMIKNSELAGVEGNEREIEKKAAFEKNNLDKNTDPQQEKTLKQKIWEIEDRRKEIEQQRWAVEDRINKIWADAENLKSEIIRKDEEAEFIKQNIKNVAGQEKLVKFALDKAKLEEEILKIIGEKENLAPAFDVAIKIENEAQTNLSEFSKKEISANAELNAIEEQEKQAGDPTKKREIEQSRWRINSELKSIVRSKWEGEEKLKQAALQSQTLQEKINTLNYRIDKIQNNIAAGEIVLEKEGLPVREIRDSIREIFKKNNIEIDQDILKDIIQAKDTQKQDLASIGQATDKPAQAPEQVNPPMATNKTEGTPTDQKTAEKTIPAQITAEEKIEQTNVNSPSAAPTAQQNAADNAKQTPAVKSEAIENIEWKPEKKPDEALTPAPQQPAKIPADILKPASETVSFYREQVDASPAKNIRTFPGESFPRNDNLEISAQNKPVGKNSDTTGEKPQDISRIPGRQLENVEMETPTATNLESRWNEIKKTTVPTAQPAAANQPAAYQPTTAAKLPEKSGSNKFLTRMMVIFILAGVLGIFLVIILSKNNTAMVVRNQKPPENATGTTPIKPGEETAAGNNGENKTQSLATISTIPIYAENLASVPNLILPYLGKSLGTNGYYKLNIQNKENNTIVGLKQFFNIYKINAPSLLYASINDNFTLFIYSNNGINRLGFVASITDASSLDTAMEGWEGSAALDTDNFFKLLGRKTQAKTNTLKFTPANAAGNTQYRSMNFAPAGDNFSIAWTDYRQKYFIFTTSNESMAKIFDQLPK